MEICKVKKEEMRRKAEILLWKTEALIQQCDSWLSAEEGNENMMREYMEQKKTKILPRLSRWIQRIIVSRT